MTHAVTFLSKCMSLWTRIAVAKSAGVSEIWFLLKYVLGPRKHASGKKSKFGQGIGLFISARKINYSNCCMVLLLAFSLSWRS